MINAWRVSRKFNYRGEEIAHLVGHEVLAWFDPENPESIVVTNPDRTNPICVARSQNPNALESIIAPESGILDRELSRIEGQASYMKTRYNVVKARFSLPSRRLLVDAQTYDLGAEIIEHKAAVETTEKNQRRRRSQAQRLEQETGIVSPERGQRQTDPDEINFLSNFLKGKDSQ